MATLLAAVNDSVWVAKTLSEAKVATGIVADPIMLATAREMRPSAGIYVPDKDAYHLSLLH